MEIRRREFAALLIGTAASLTLNGPASAQSTQDDPLPSWNEGAAKDSILKFVQDTTQKSSPHYVPPEERIASFDQDGTLWVEHPIYTQVMFCLESVPALVVEQPELKNREPFKTVLSGDRAKMAKFSMEDVFEIVLAVQSGMTVEVFRDKALKWLDTARDTRWNRPYTDLVYLPMLEVLHYLLDNGYTTFIATGGSSGFVREYSHKVYGIPPHQVAGTAQPVMFGFNKKHEPTLTREPKLVLNNLEAGKIENFWLMYGQRPQAAFGNSSTDDQQMLEYVKAGGPACLSVAVLHDDPVREYAYGPATGLPNTSVGTFSQEMYDMAMEQKWTVVSMKNDWKRIFTFSE